MTMKRLSRHLWLSAVLLALWPAPAPTQMCKWVDENGTVHYGDRPSGARTEERLAMTYTRILKAVRTIRYTVDDIHDIWMFE